MSRRKNRKLFNNNTISRAVRNIIIIILYYTVIVVTASLSLLLVGTLVTIKSFHVRRFSSRTRTCIYYTYIIMSRIRVRLKVWLASFVQVHYIMVLVRILIWVSGQKTRRHNWLAADVRNELTQIIPIKPATAAAVPTRRLKPIISLYTSCTLLYNNINTNLLRSSNYGPTNKRE